MLSRNSPISISILRIELRLKDKKKIKSAFGSCLWGELDDRKIAEYFHQEIYTQLFVRFNKWQSTRERELKKLIKDCRKESSKKWHDNVMHEIKNLEIKIGLPYILDIEQVCNAFRKLPDPYNNANRSIKSLLNIKVKADVYKNNDIDKVFEIFDSLESYAMLAI